MFWADEISAEAKKRANGAAIVIRDEKTVSGRVHVGSMRGAAIHGVIHETLEAEGVVNTFLWEHNDFFQRLLEQRRHASILSAGGTMC